MEIEKGRDEEIERDKERKRDGERDGYRKIH